MQSTTALTSTFLDPRRYRNWIRIWLALGVSVSAQLFTQLWLFIRSRGWEVALRQWYASYP